MGWGEWDGRVVVRVAGGGGRCRLLGRADQQGAAPTAQVRGKRTTRHPVSARQVARRLQVSRTSALHSAPPSRNGARSKTGSRSSVLIACSAAMAEGCRCPGERAAPIAVMRRMQRLHRDGGKVRAGKKVGCERECAAPTRPLHAGRTRSLDGSTMGACLFIQQQRE